MNACKHIVLLIFYFNCLFLLYYSQVLNTRQIFQLRCFHLMSSANFENIRSYSVWNSFCLLNNFHSDSHGWVQEDAMAHTHSGKREVWLHSSCPRSATADGVSSVVRLFPLHPFTFFPVFFFPMDFVCRHALVFSSNPDIDNRILNYQNFPFIC